jgi:DNA-directed RNA polymerase specialized sigma24 family protein
MSETNRAGYNARTENEVPPADKRPALDELTEAEREAFETVEMGDIGPREFARETDRSPGTVSNLLRQARLKVELAEARETGGEQA